MTEIQALATFGGAMALAGGLAGSAVGIANAASSGVATLSEEPGQLRNVIVLASLPMTQSFYGLIILIIILTVVLPKIAAAGVGAGLAVLGIGIMAGFAELFSAVFQGSVCASGIALLPKTKGRILTASMMLAVFVELIGVLGLVFTIMALSILKLM
ncbi:MAG: ATPase [Deltaproteobacteria bacterium]|nr:ATPase [Deltaproteobacteria bacterium]MBW2594636.1 ATPase [Deltaproteobacteria bacterium]MBW2649514.1 ATPase [Deltaproteobacteria bacterium]